MTRADDDLRHSWNARGEAAGFHVVQQLPYSSHRILEIRSLAMHAVIAAKIERDPALISIAQKNLDRWQARWKDAAPHWLAEWRAILKRPGRKSLRSSPT